MTRVRGLALFSALTCAIVAPASAQTLSGSSTPVIDGVVDNLEWAGADSEIFVVKLPGGDVTGGAFKVMNDATNLYLGFVIVYNDDLIDVSVNFDASGDGDTLGVGDDAIGFTTTSSLARDNFYTANTGDFDTNDSGTLDVIGATSVSESATYIELSHPLDSGDAGHDIAVGPGELLPFYVTVRLFPCCMDSFYPGSAAGIEAQILIAPEATSGSTTALAALLGFAFRDARRRSARR